MRATSETPTPASANTQRATPRNTETMGSTGARPRRAPVEPAGSDLQPDALHLGVEIEGVAAQLAPVAALLVAAEGGARIEHVVAVDPHRAGANGACHPVRLAHVARPYPGGEAVGGVVPLQDGVVLVLEGNDGDDRAEDLLARDLHGVAHAGEDGGLHEVALLEALGGVALPADQRLRAFLLPRLEIAAHAIELVLADERADARLGIEAGPLLHARGGLGQLVGELVVHLLLDEEPGTGAAHLPGTEEHAEERALHGRVGIGVAEDDVGRLATQLEGDPLQRARRLAMDLLPHLGGAGERDLVDQGMVNERP